MSSLMSGPLLVIVGPTASGKSALAVRLAQAHDGEIISADSVQLYRHFDIGSGKPSLEERGGIAHHLMDALEPDSAADAAWWAEQADRTVRDIRARGKLPIVCGGTFLWVRALVLGLVAAPPADDGIREQHRQWAERDGRAALHAQLSRVDPVLAAKLNPNDLVRVSRGLEVFELTGAPLSEWQRQHGFAEVRHPHRLIGVGHTREELDERIRRRAQAMFDAGFMAEVQRLLEAGFGEARAMGSVGYRQVKEALARGEQLPSEELLDQIVRATRIFARRQRTWLRDEAVQWLSPDALQDDAHTLTRKLGA